MKAGVRAVDEKEDRRRDRKRNERRNGGGADRLRKEKEIGKRRGRNKLGHIPPCPKRAEVV